jgi:hypothetical protein
MRARTPILTLVGLSVATAVLLSGCGASAPASPTSPPAAAVATTAPASPTAAPATPTAAATTGESLKATVATSTPAAANTGESLKPATPTAGGSADSLRAATATPSGQQPAATPASVRDSLKPIETPKPTQAAQPTQPPAKAPSDGKIKPVTKLQVQPTPVPPARKGVANANVDPMKYAQEMVTDLEQLAGAVQALGDFANAYEEGSIAEDELVAGFNKQAGIVRAVYQREVQRDYPPQLKEIDDYFVESLRSASKMVDSLVMALQTGDQKYVTEAEGHAQKFEFFANELVKRLQ